MNEKQSEVVAGIMDEIGFKRQETEDADVVIYNTCTVRENANLKVYGRLGKLHSLKKSNPDMKIALFGCMMQEKQVVDKIQKDYPFVNLVFGTHNIFKFAELFYEMENRDSQLIDIWEGTDKIVEELPTERTLMKVNETKLTRYTLIASVIIIVCPALIAAVFNELSVILN